AQLSFLQFAPALSFVLPVRDAVASPRAARFLPLREWTTAHNSSRTRLRSADRMSEFVRDLPTKELPRLSPQRHRYRRCPGRIRWRRALGGPPDTSPHGWRSDPAAPDSPPPERSRWPRVAIARRFLQTSRCW